MTILVAFITALITSFVAPLVLEMWKKRVVEQQQEKERQDKIVKTQFEVVENLNRILWTYRASANFLVSDYKDKQTDNEIFKKHIQTYEEISVYTNKELVIEAFRARMYFQNNDLYEKLMKMFGELFDVDYRLFSQQIKQEYKYDPSKENLTEWGEIHHDVVEFFEGIKELLDELFASVCGSNGAPPNKSPNRTRN